MIGQYILDKNGNPQLCADILEWGQWFETADRHVAQDTLPSGVRVSTVFLGLDHDFGFHGKPVLWETMVFGGPHNNYQERYTSREEALIGHQRAVAIANGEIEE